MLIRPYRPEDLDILRTMTVAAFEGVSIDHNIERKFGLINERNWLWRKGRHVDADAAAQPDGIFVVEFDGKVGGYISTRLDRQSGIGWIPNLVVAPGLRGQGLGRRLIEHALNYFRSMGMSLAKIETLDQNPIGQHLYPACGFQEVARQIHYVMKLAE